jgi:hypothetical protein
VHEGPMHDYERVREVSRRVRNEAHELRKTAGELQQRSEALRADRHALRRLGIPAVWPERITVSE